MHFWLMVAIVAVRCSLVASPAVRPSVSRCLQAAIAQLNCMQREYSRSRPSHYASTPRWRQNNIICDQSNYFALVYSIITAAWHCMADALVGWLTDWVTARLLDCSTAMANSTRGCLTGNGLRSTRLRYTFLLLRSWLTFSKQFCPPFWHPLLPLPLRCTFPNKMSPNAQNMQMFAIFKPMNTPFCAMRN